MNTIENGLLTPKYKTLMLAMAFACVGCLQHNIYAMQSNNPNQQNNEQEQKSIVRKAIDNTRDVCFLVIGIVTGENNPGLPSSPSTVMFEEINTNGANQSGLSNVIAPMHTNHTRSIDGFSDISIRFHADHAGDLHEMINGMCISNEDKHLNKALIKTVNNPFQPLSHLLNSPEILEKLLENMRVFGDLWNSKDNVSKEYFYNFLKNIVFSIDTKNGGKSTHFETWYKNFYPKFKTNTRAKNIIQMIYFSILLDFVCNSDSNMIKNMWKRLPESKTKNIIDIFYHMKDANARAFSFEFFTLCNDLRNFDNTPMATQWECTVWITSVPNLNLFLWVVPVLLTKKSVNNLNDIIITIYNANVKDFYFPRGLQYLPHVTILTLSNKHERFVGGVFGLFQSKSGGTSSNTFTNPNGFLFALDPQRPENELLAND